MSSFIKFRRSECPMRSFKQGGITSYGAVSGRGQELYSTLTVQPKQQLYEEFEEDYEEDFEMEMGGLQ